MGHAGSRRRTARSTCAPTARAAARPTQHATARLTGYATGALLVRLADEGARVVLTLLAVRRTGSAATGGVLVAALLAQQVVAAPLVGLLADRMRRPQRLTSLAALGFAGFALPSQQSSCPAVHSPGSRSLSTFVT